MRDNLNLISSNTSLKRENKNSSKKKRKKKLKNEILKYQKEKNF